MIGQGIEEGPLIRPNFGDFDKPDIVGIGIRREKVEEGGVERERARVGVERREREREENVGLGGRSEDTP